MNDAESWRWVWLVVAAAGLAGEMVTAGTFFLLPFGLGAAAACAAAFAGASLDVQWLVFVATSLGLFAATRPLARRLDRTVGGEGIGARRWIGQSAVVLSDIPSGADETGLVRIGREEWRAQTGNGAPVPAGERVVVIDVTGTRLIVQPQEEGASE